MKKHIIEDQVRNRFGVYNELGIKLNKDAQEIVEQYLERHKGEAPLSVLQEVLFFAINAQAARVSIEVFADRLDEK